MNEFYVELDEFIDNLIDKKNDYKILSFVVEELGYISDEVLDHIAKKIDVFPFSLESTIKFYPKLQAARGKNYVEICSGRGCKQLGLKEKIKELQSKVNFPIEERHCLGHCNKPYNVRINGENYRYKNLDELERVILNLK